MIAFESNRVPELDRKYSRDRPNPYFLRKLARPNLWNSASAALMDSGFRMSSSAMILTLVGIAVKVKVAVAPHIGGYKSLFAAAMWSRRSFLFSADITNMRDLLMFPATRTK
jgi:hypothetical protein